MDVKKGLAKILAATTLIASTGMPLRAQQIPTYHGVPIQYADTSLEPSLYRYVLSQDVIKAAENSITAEAVVAYLNNHPEEVPDFAKYTQTTEEFVRTIIDGQMARGENYELSGISFNFNPENNNRTLVMGLDDYVRNIEPRNGVATTTGQSRVGRELSPEGMGWLDKFLYRVFEEQGTYMQRNLEEGVTTAVDGLRAQYPGLEGDLQRILRQLRVIGRGQENIAENLGEMQAILEYLQKITPEDFSERLSALEQYLKDRNTPPSVRIAVNGSPIPENYTIMPGTNLVLEQIVTDSEGLDKASYSWIIYPNGSSEPRKSGGRTLALRDLQEGQSYTLIAVANDNHAKNPMEGYAEANISVQGVQARKKDRTGEYIGIAALIFGGIALANQGNGGGPSPTGPDGGENPNDDVTTGPVGQFAQSGNSYGRLYTMPIADFGNLKLLNCIPVSGTRPFVMASYSLGGLQITNDGNRTMLEGRFSF